MDVLRFITAGNVDDGKSTLIGRLLYDTGNIKADVLQAVSADDAVNLAYVTDGLRSERAQGITIDVAYKYFTTSTRKYIVTDAPGHFQYTRNLVTGASAADAIIILIDAQNGITEQTRRHSLVASFLQIKQVVVAINKMDAVGFSEAVFKRIKEEYETSIMAKLEMGAVTFIPISALNGDNVITTSQNMSWYAGASLMQCLDAYQPVQPGTDAFRFAVQYVSMVGQTQLCFGKVISGKVRVGQNISMGTAQKNVTIKELTIGQMECDAAYAGQNVCLAIDSEHAIKRGEILSDTLNAPTIGQEITATLCWLDTQPLALHNEYMLQMNSTDTVCRVTSIVSKIDVATYHHETGSSELNMNEFAIVSIHTAAVIAYDAFNYIPATGRGIIIDKQSNYTCGAFTIL